METVESLYKVSVVILAFLASATAITIVLHVIVNNIGLWALRNKKWNRRLNQLEDDFHEMRVDMSQLKKSKTKKRIK